MPRLRGPVTHYDYRGAPFRMPRYCQPLVGDPVRTTTERDAVTCKKCQRKLARMPREHGVHVD